MKKRFFLRALSILALMLVSSCAGIGILYLFYTMVQSIAGIRIRYTGQRYEDIQLMVFLILSGLLPLVFLGYWRFTPVYTRKRKVFSLLLFAGCLVLSLGIRYLLIIYEVVQRRQTLSGSTGSFLLPSEWVLAGTLHLWICLAAAMVAGGLVIFWLLREIKCENNSFSFEE